MARDATVDRTVASSSTSTAFAGTAFSAWAAAFAIGALIHLWQAAPLLWSVAPLAAVAAVAVLLAPSSPVRLVVLFGLLFVEILTWLPDLLNHQILVGVLAVTFVGWWLALAWRSPAQARDPAVMYERVAPYLRVAFITMWFLAAVAKLNTGFTDVVTTCSVWILDSIPGVEVPPVLSPLAIVGTLALELTIPALLVFHRTRPLAVVLGFGFHLVSAFAGHASFSGFAWSFYLLFLPPAMIARAVVMARGARPEWVRRGIAAAVAHTPLTLVVVGGLWLVIRLLLPAALQSPVRNWGAALVYLLWMGVCAWLLFRLRRHWLGAPGPRASLRVRNGVMLFGLALLVVTAASPYLGLKTRASLTMFSNLRTEPGHWNHLFIPESARVFDWQNGEARFLSTDDPALAAKMAKSESDDSTLLGLRRLVDEFPDATVRYELDGVERVAAPVSADPVLGQPLSPSQDWFAAMRPFDHSETCQH